MDIKSSSGYLKSWARCSHSTESVVKKSVDSKLHACVMLVSIKWVSGTFRVKSIVLTLVLLVDLFFHWGWYD